MATALRRIAFFAALVLIWWQLARMEVWDATLFPGPDRTLSVFAELLRSGELGIAVASSMRRVMAGYALSLAIGLPLGILLARAKWAEDTLGSIVTGLQALPSICWLPLALLWFGLNDSAILFVVVMGSMVSITAAVRDGVRNLPPTYVRAAATMGTGPLALYAHVLFPAALPTILVGAKLGWSYAWRALMAGELLFVSMGLGHVLLMGRELADMAQVLSVMGVIMAIGLLSDALVFNPLERYVRERYGLGSPN